MRLVIPSGNGRGKKGRDPFRCPERKFRIFNFIFKKIQNEIQKKTLKMYIVESRLLDADAKIFLSHYEIK